MVVSFFAATTSPEGAVFLLRTVYSIDRRMAFSLTAASFCRAVTSSPITLLECPCQFFFQSLANLVPRIARIAQCRLTALSILKIKDKDNGFSPSGVVFMVKATALRQDLLTYYVVMNAAEEVNPIKAVVMALRHCNRPVDSETMSVRDLRGAKGRVAWLWNVLLLRYCKDKKILTRIACVGAVDYLRLVVIWSTSVGGQPPGRIQRVA